jgi:WD40 repeat protein
VAASGGLAFVAGIATIEVFKSSQRVHEAKPSFVPSSIAVYNTSVAVGGEVSTTPTHSFAHQLIYLKQQDNKVHLYEWDGQALRETGKLEGNKSVVSALAFSPDGALIAAGEVSVRQVYTLLLFNAIIQSSGKICLFKLADKTLVTSRWAYHTAKVNSLQFTADGQHCASGSLDTHVYVWSVARPLKSIAIKNAGPGGVNAVLWIGGTKLATAGADGSMRTWDVTFHA